MLKSLLSFIILVAFFWFFPDLYLWTRNGSNALFQEAANVQDRRVEIKVAYPIPLLPARFGVIAKGEKDFYVELYSESDRESFGASTLDGTAIISQIKNGLYRVRVGYSREFGDNDMRRHIERREPLLLPGEELRTSLTEIDIQGDVFAVAVVLEDTRTGSL